MEYYLTVRKKQILPFAAWMELEGIMLSEISQAEKDRYCISLILKYKKAKSAGTKQY